MNWFLNLKIRTKLLVAFALISAMALTTGYIGIININTINDNDTELYENMTVPLGYMSDISTSFQRVRVNTREILLARNQQEISTYIEKIRNYRDSINTIGKEFEKKILSTEMRNLWTEFMNSRVEFGKDLDRFFELVASRKKRRSICFCEEPAR